MDLIDVAAALFSAVLHAGWNAAVKNNRDPSGAMTAQMVLSALIVLPGLLWTGLPDAAAWPWIVASTAMNVLTISALLRAYEQGGFGIVYPIQRAVAVVLVVPLAALLAGDRLGLSGLAGIAIMVAALGVLSFDAARGNGVSFEAMAWTLAAGVGTAAYIMCDARGVRAAGSPLAYGFVVSATNAIAMLVRQRRNGPILAQMSGHWLGAVPIAVASSVSYLLILWVWGHAPIAPSAALRDTSAIFAILIAVVWLKEPFTRARIAAALLAAAAIPLLRFG